MATRPAMCKIFIMIRFNFRQQTVHPHLTIPKWARMALGMKSAFDKVMKNRTRAGLGVYTRKARPFRSCFSSSFFPVFLLFAGLIVPKVFGANHYCLPSGSGSGAGTDWSNAYAGIPTAKLVRGDTYYLGAGNYGAPTFSTANSGTSVITIRAATTSSYGTNTGWTSGLAGQAVFTGGVQIQSDYWTFDGQSRGGYTNGYNIKFQSTSVQNQDCVDLNSGNRNFTDIRFQYCEFYGTHGAVANSDETAIYIYPSCNNFYLGYSWVHDTGGDSVMANFGGGSGINHTYEYDWIAKNHQEYNSDHSQGLAECSSNLVVRFCIFQDIISSGFITDPTPGTPPIANWEIYGNVFFWDSAFAALSSSFVGDGIVGFFGQTYSGHFYFYNNAIVGIHSAAGNVDNAGFYSIPVSGSSQQIYNNIWYNCDSIEYLGSSGNNVDYNSYYGFDNSNDTSAHKVFSSTGNPFVNVGANNFQLSAATAAGIPLAAPYNTDMNGNARGADGTWDRGAYEFGGAASTNPPVITGLQATNVSDRSATVVWVTDKQSTSILQYGLSASYGNSLTNSTLTNSHSITISNLTANTAYNYLVKSADAAGNVGSSTNSTFTTLVSDITPPAVSLATPLQSTVIAGTTTLSANASDNGVIAGVQFLVDGHPVGSSITSAPYANNWNSISVTNGTHSIQARATDAAGNTATSLVVNVQIQNIVTNGLVGYWSFDEGSGTLAADSSGFGGTATLNTGAAWTTNAVLGTSALLLNAASTSSASVPDSTALEISGDLTITMWVKHNGLPATNSWMYYLEKGENNQENYGFGAYSDTNGTRLFFEFVDATGTSRYYSQGTSLMLDTTVWRHVAVIFDHTHGQLSFFIKGQLVSTNAVAQSLTVAANPLVIGRQNITGYEFYMNGSIDDLRIYNRALTASEINALSLVGSFMPSAPVMSN